MGDICFYDFGDTKFDVVVISEVLEHVHSPHLAIENIRNVLKDRGCLILTVPFIFPIHDRPHDYYRYTRYGLEFLLKDFKDVEISEKNSWAETINVLGPRLIMDKKMTSQLLGIFMLAVAFMMLPTVFIVSKLVPSDIMTTGYLVTAKK